LLLFLVLLHVHDGFILSRPSGTRIQRAPVVQHRDNQDCSVCSSVLCVAYCCLLGCVGVRYTQRMVRNSATHFEDDDEW